MIQFLIYKAVIFIVHVLGRRRGYAFARFMAERHYRSSPKDRQAVINNLQQIQRTKSDVRPQARQVFYNFAEYLVDFFLMYKIVDRKFVAEHVRILGREHLEAAFARGKGVLLLTAHVGNWEMGAAVMNQMGYPVTAIALPHKSPLVNRLFNRQREAHGVNVIPSNTAVRRCMEALRKNRTVAVLGDRDFGSFGEPLSFCGRPTLIPKGAAFFALKTGAAIVPAFLIPDGKGEYTFQAYEMILPPDGDRDDRVAELDLMKRYVEVIERQVRLDPTQWLMFREFGIEYEDLSSDTRVQRGTGARVSR